MPIPVKRVLKIVELLLFSGIIVTVIRIIGG
jgi:hypothetical protein